VVVVSGVSGDGVDDVLRAIVREIVKRRGNKIVRKEAKPEWSP
jgi:hypothetical protein